MTAAKSQRSETCVAGGRKKKLNGYIVQGANTGRKTGLKSNILQLKPKEICHCLNCVQCLQLARDFDKENSRCADNLQYP